MEASAWEGIIIIAILIIVAIITINHSDNDGEMDESNALVRYDEANKIDEENDRLKKEKNNQ